MNVGKICNRPAVCVAAGAPLSEVAGLMREYHVGAVIVTKAPIDQPVVIGIITDRDIVHAQLQGVADLSRLSAVDVMTHDPLVLDEQASVGDAIQRMRARGVRRAPVVTASGAIVGMISTDDLLMHVAEELISLACLVAQQPRKEAA